jgi:methylglyoxal synthase
MGRKMQTLIQVRVLVYFQFITYVKAMVDFIDLQALCKMCMLWNIWFTSKAKTTKCMVLLMVIIMLLHVTFMFIVVPYGPL